MAWQNTSTGDSALNSSVPDQKDLICYTAVAWRVYLSKLQTNLLGILYGLTILPVVSLNLIIVIVLLKSNMWRRKSKFLIFLLSLSDSFLGSVTIPCSVILCSLLSHERACWFERVFMFLGQTSGHFSFYVTLAIAVQRFTKIRPSITERFRLTDLAFRRSGQKYTTLAIFTWSCVHGFVAAHYFGLLKTIVPNILMITLRFVWLLTVFAIYLRVYCSVSRDVRDITTSSSREANEGPPPALYSRFNRMVYIIILAFIISHVPLAIADTWTGYYTLILRTKAPISSRFFYYLSIFFAFLNSAVNAVIFLYSDKFMFESCKKMFGFKSN